MRKNLIVPVLRVSQAIPDNCCTVLHVRKELMFAVLYHTLLEEYTRKSFYLSISFSERISCYLYLLLRNRLITSKDLIVTVLRVRKDLIFAKFHVRKVLIVAVLYPV
jgi:hypothetical protein